jgi:hypothetical protein
MVLLQSAALTASTVLVATEENPAAVQHMHVMSRDAPPNVLPCLRGMAPVGGEM